MKDVHVVGKKMTRNAGKMAKLIGCAFHFEEFNQKPLYKDLLKYNQKIYYWKVQMIVLIFKENLVLFQQLNLGTQYFLLDIR